MLTTTYDGATLRVYRNEVLELYIPCKGLKLKNVRCGNLCTNLQQWSRALNQDEVGALSNKR